MNQFKLVFKHYFMRLMKDKLALGLQLVLPLFLILFMVGLDADDPFVGEAWAMIASTFIITFATFGGQWAMGHIFDDLKETRKWRLLATPVDASVFRKAAMLASMAISIVNSLIIIIVTTIIRPVIWGNLPLLVGVVILTILLSHSFCYFITVVMKNYKSANAATTVILMGLAIIGGGIVIGLPNIVNIDAFTFVHDYITPLSMGRQAVLHGGLGATFVDGQIILSHTDWHVVLLNIGLLIGLTTLFAVLSFVIERVKKS